MNAQPRLNFTAQRVTTFQTCRVKLHSHPSGDKHKSAFAKKWIIKISISSFTERVKKSFVVLLPPANEVCEGYVFTPVCQSFCSQGGGVPRQVQPPTSPRVGTPPGQVHPPDRYTPGSKACWEIRATSGPYASYWNAFLF